MKSKQEVDLWAAKYQAYLESDAWKNKRARVLAHWRNRCAICNSSDHLHVHHRSYERLFNELPTDLIPLCADCHELHHKHIRRGEGRMTTAYELGKQFEAELKGGYYG